MLTIYEKIECFRNVPNVLQWKTNEKQSNWKEKHTYLLKWLQH